MIASKKLLLTLLYFTCITSYAAKLPSVFDGYITNVPSATEFEVGQRHIECDSKTKLSIQYLIPGNENTPETDTTLDKTPLHIGMAIHVKGTFQQGKARFIAKEINIFLNFDLDPHPEQSLTGIGLIQQLPQIHREEPGWLGTLWISGYPVQLTEQTKLLSAKGGELSLEEIHPNMFATYHAVRKRDNSILASEISFSPNIIDEKEKEYRKKTEPEIDEPDYKNHTPGTVKYHLAWALNILPDKDLQDYVREVGNSLVPQYQKDLPASDPAKIDFRFYLINHPSKWKTGTMDDVSSSPNGVILIPENVLAALENEAQLAALLSNAIAASLEKEFYNHRGRINTQNYIGLASNLGGLYTFPLSIGNSIAVDNLMFQLNERADRIGLQYLLQAGYDIRQAAFVSVIATNHVFKNPVSSRSNSPARVRSLMNDLRLDYTSTDYTNLKLNREAYQQMLTKLRSISPKLPQPKNHE